jgi:histone H3/H4
VARLRIECINKTDRENPHERIRNVGGRNADGTRWKKTQEQAISEIENKVNQFYVHVGENTIDVIVATHNGHKYIKTRNDGIQPDNLLKLPECP